MLLGRVWLDSMMLLGRSWVVTRLVARWLPGGCKVVARRFPYNGLARMIDKIHENEATVNRVKYNL